MSFAPFLALITATLLAMLSSQASLPLSAIGYFWALLHLLASIAAWPKR